MSYDPHNDELSELLSAYIDGELTAEEQARVEQRLAENADFRQLHDELRALRASLESLPRYRVTQDLASAVLRRAERAMLSTPAVSAYQNEPDTDLTPAQPTRTELLGRGLRAFRWTVVALAVAVLIMIVNPRRREFVNEVAKKSEVNQSAADQAEVPREQAVMSAPEAIESADNKPADLAFEIKAPAEDRTPALAGDANKLNRAADRAGKDTEAGKNADKVMPAEPATLAKPAASPEPSAPDPNAGEKVADEKSEAAPMQLEKLAVPTPRAAPAPAAVDAPAAPAATATPPSEGAPVVKDLDGVEGKAKNAPANRALVKESQVRSREEMPADDAPVANQPLAGAKRGSAVRDAPQMQFKWRLGPAQMRAEQAPDQVLVVHCRITSEALKSGAFEQLLARQEIAFAQADERAESAYAAKPQTAKAIEQPAAEAVAAQDKLDDAKPRDGETETEVVQVDAVLVEASSAQIKATLDDLHKQGDSLGYLSTQPTSASALGLTTPSNADAVPSNAAPAAPPAVLGESEQSQLRKKLADSKLADSAAAETKSLKSNALEDFKSADADAQSQPAGAVGGGGGGAGIAGSSNAAGFGVGSGGGSGKVRPRGTAERIAITDELRRLTEKTSGERDGRRRDRIAVDAAAPAKADFGDATREATKSDRSGLGRRNVAGQFSQSQQPAARQGAIEFVPTPGQDGVQPLTSGGAVNLQKGGLQARGTPQAAARVQLKQGETAEPPKQRVLFLLHVMPSTAGEVPSAEAPQ